MSRVKLTFASILAFTVALPTLVTANADDLSEQVRNLLSAFHETYAIPGATVSYALPDGSVGDAAVGLADAEAGIAATPNTRMLAASVGKTIVGALVLALESDGVLSRSDLVADYLGGEDWFDALPNASTVTVGHLLTHSAGLPDHVHLEGVAQRMLDAGANGVFEPEDAITFILGRDPLFEAGRGWSYTDTGHLLLGLVIEAASEADFFDLVSARFLVPIGLDATTSSVTPALADLAVGYTIEDNVFGLPIRTNDEGGALLWNPAIEWTGGGFISTSHDLSYWGDALFTGEAINTPHLERLLDAVPVHPDAPDILYGSGVAIYANTPLGPVYGHGGWVPGYVTSLRHCADHGITIAFQINTDAGIVDDSTDLVPALEAALADLLIRAVTQE
ncbi:beta-lactamase family protein [Rhodobacteraceae bacterium N5(2021)]|uniref:Beta-lactamase family protein n=1 Tax=Gymnodinialimonas phycosphaerae TaxID=2841589 RepID=A0A975TZ66_9RHOB|nr:serine hydrolase domain-containing protein [Gymnodinialimonas phycosphaerae]MBY4892653.1 beta-lactamase family protein [Gymnodinialimonas phycosphaerae]